ncbi:hypothetical protein B4168_2976 [Anoxybacillus flavithermus]|nr:hypothetical protein B4168_2976 [Anoxybacillus flavithermus]
MHVLNITTSFALFSYNKNKEREDRNVAAVEELDSWKAKTNCSNAVWKK